MSEVRRYSDANHLAHTAAELFVALAKPAIAEQGRFTVALSGGSTPKALYQLLAREPYANQIEWPHVHIFWGDERCVSPDHPDSNYRMAREAFLQYVPLLPENIHPMHGDIDPAQASAEYEQQLRIFFGNGLPAFNLVLLGMGDDGHTASLFPGTAAIHEQNRWVIGHYVEKLESWRLTLTPPVINAAAQITFLVAGKSKAERLRDVLKGPYQPDVLPSQIVKPTEGRLVWLVDEEAASLL